MKSICGESTTTMNDHIVLWIICRQLRMQAKLNNVSELIKRVVLIQGKGQLLPMIQDEPELCLLVEAMQHNGFALEQEAMWLSGY